MKLRPFIAAVILAAAACDTSGLQAPAGSSIVLIASAVVLPVNGDAEITAHVFEGTFSAADPATPANPNTPAAPAAVGTPVHDGTVVHFTTTLGRLEPQEARTVGGKAVVRLVGDGRSGTATIMALSGPATKTLDIKVGVAGASKIVVAANPQVLTPLLPSTTIIARVDDAQGNGLMGVPVHFSSTAGVIAETPVLTDRFGIAQTTLQTSTNASVVAAIGSAAGQTATVNVTVTSSSGG